MLHNLAQLKIGSELCGAGGSLTVDYCCKSLFCLADTESIYTVTTQEQVEKYGKNFTWEVKGKLMGTSEREGWSILFRELDLVGKADMDKMMAETRQRREELFPTCQLMPGTCMIWSKR